MLDELRKKKRLQSLSASSKTSKSLKNDIDNGRLARRRYAEMSGKDEEELVREELNNATGTDPVYDKKHGPEYGYNPTRSGSLNLARKPIYDALTDEEREKKRKRLAELYKGN